LLVSGIYVAILNTVIAFTLAFVDGLETASITKFALFGACNGFVSSVFAVGLISLGESMLNLPTVFRLQELTDTSLPLLKELSESAMGSYIHSINVANLAETAANAVHANGLLAKVGALYHDIGKIDNAAYFTENQGDFFTCGQKVGLFGTKNKICLSIAERDCAKRQKRKRTRDPVRFLFGIQFFSLSV
jgi:putative nucleotidyltransferase with HDIG domain